MERYKRDAAILISNEGVLIIMLKEKIQEYWLNLQQEFNHNYELKFMTYYEFNKEFEPDWTEEECFDAAFDHREERGLVYRKICYIPMETLRFYSEVANAELDVILECYQLDLRHELGHCMDEIGLDAESRYQYQQYNHYFTGNYEFFNQIPREKRANKLGRVNVEMYEKLEKYLNDKWPLRSISKEIWRQYL